MRAKVDDVTERVRRFFEIARDKELPREKMILEFARLVGCNRLTVYRWIGGHNSVSNAYAPQVRKVLARFEKKFRISP